MKRSARSLIQLGFRLTIKGALIFGIFAVFMTGAQGFAFAEAYPTAEAQRDFATSLRAAPALGVLYGEIDTLTSPAGYVVYRTSVVLGLIAALWGVSATTRITRGSEEDGQLELITAGNVARPTAQLLIFAGFILSVIVSASIILIGNVVINMQPVVGMTLGEAATLTALITSLTILFSSLAFFTSQLSQTRRRALFYAVIPLAIAFAIRAIGNTSDNFYDLKYWSPFGWLDLVSPTLHPQIAWFTPIVICTLIFLIIGHLFANRRDLGEGIIYESTRAKSHFRLIRSPVSLTFRQSIPSMVAWFIGVAAISSLMAALAKIAVDALSESPALSAVIVKFGGADNLNLAFLGSGTVFVIMTLLIMIATCLARMKKDELAGFLELQFAHPTHRISWLLQQFSLISLTTITMLVAGALITWLVATSQDITVSLNDLLLITIAQSGVLMLCIGIGILFYTITPRIAAPIIYFIIAWSFIIDMLQSIITINDAIVRTSLFYYLPLSISETPDWTTFGILITSTFGCIIIGSLVFNCRDMIAE